MIDKRTYAHENIQRIVTTYGASYELVQRAVFALGLVEALVQTDLSFTFKGGSSLMLLFYTPKRLSTDVDILVDPDTDIEQAIQNAARVFPFISYKESIRQTNKAISKKHYKIQYKSPRDGRDINVIVDVLFAPNRYPKRTNLPIRSTLLVEDGREPMHVVVPSPECLLGDKLTAFAPHTIGISFFNDDFSNDKRLEVIKQFYDVATLFGVCKDFALANDAYHAVAEDEIAYRGSRFTIEECLNDSFRAALCILSWGRFEPDDYPNYVYGFKSIRDHIIGINLNPNNTFAPAAIIMLLSACVLRNIDPFNLIIQKQPLFNDLPYSAVNKLARKNPNIFDIAATAIRIMYETAH